LQLIGALAPVSNAPVARLEYDPKAQARANEPVFISTGKQSC